MPDAPVDSIPVTRQSAKPAADQRQRVQLPAAQGNPVPLRVVALRDGTYPDPGKQVARYRSKGEVFELRTREDFAREWMRELSPGEAGTLAPETKPSIPQTTAPKIKPVSPFPPFQ